MKLKVSLLVVAILALSASPAAASLSKGRWLLGVAGGLLAPTGDYRDDAKTGYDMGVRADYILATTASIGLDLAFNRNDISDGLKSSLEIRYPGVAIDGRHEIVQVGAHGTLFVSPESKVRPYLTVGSGLYDVKETVNIPGTPGSQSKSNAGINGGIGVLFDTGTKAHIGLQGSYHNIFTSGSSTGYMNANLMLVFDLGKK